MKVRGGKKMVRGGKKMVRGGKEMARGGGMMKRGGERKNCGGNCCGGEPTRVNRSVKSGGSWGETQSRGGRTVGLRSLSANARRCGWNGKSVKGEKSGRSGRDGTSEGGWSGRGMSVGSGEHGRSGVGGVGPCGRSSGSRMGGGLGVVSAWDRRTLLTFVAKLQSIKANKGGGGSERERERKGEEGGRGGIGYIEETVGRGHMVSGAATGQRRNSG